MAREFNGSTDRASLADIASLGDFTVCCIVRPITNTTGDTAFAWDNYPTTPRNNCLFQPKNDGGTGFIAEVAVAGTGGAFTFGQGDLSTGVDHRIVLTRAGTTANLYVDGVDIGAITVGSGTFTAQNIRLGNHFYSGTENEQANVRLSEYAIYAVAWTQAEVTRFQAGLRSRQVKRDSRLRDLPLDGVLSPEPDYSGNRGDATLTGTTRANHPPIAMFTRQRSLSKAQRR